MTTGDDPETRRRRAVRRFASGVAVLTVKHDHTVHGTTVSALMSVSRDPLVVAACLRRDSTFTRYVLSAGRFAVNVLTADQAPLAGWFADPARPVGLTQFDCVDWQVDPTTGAPLIGGALSRFACRLLDRVPVGGNDILLAEVTSGSVGPGGPGSPVGMEAPLFCLDGQLHDGVQAVPRVLGHPAAVSSRLAVSARPALS
jgi:flavin reductase (DIM6/NTAB) family NADH-FMN oxidoreductase RutF